MHTLTALEAQDEVDRDTRRRLALGALAAASLIVGAAIVTSVPWMLQNATDLATATLFAVVGATTLAVGGRGVLVTDYRLKPGSGAIFLVVAVVGAFALVSSLLYIGIASGDYRAPVEVEEPSDPLDDLRSTMETRT
jgi:hypothetical protein